MPNGYEKYTQYIEEKYLKPQVDPKIIDFVSTPSPTELDWKSASDKQPTRMYPTPDMVDWSLMGKGLPRDATMIQTAGYGLHTILETGEYLHGSAIKWLQDSNIAPLRWFGKTYDKWGVLGMYFFVNTVWDGASAGLLSEANRRQAKTEREYMAQGLYPVQVGQRTEYETKEYIMKNYLPIRTGKMTWEEFLQQVQTRQEKNQFMKEEPMGYWNSMGNSIANAEHAVTVMLKAGADPKAAWIAGMAVNVFADPFTYMTIPTTVRQFYKAGSNIMKGGFLRNSVFKLAKENLIDVARGGKLKWSLNNVIHQDAQGNWISRITGDIIPKEKVTQLSKHIGKDLEGWTIDQMIQYGQKQALLGKVSVDDLFEDTGYGIKNIVKKIAADPRLAKYKDVLDIRDPKHIENFKKVILEHPTIYKKIINMYPEAYRKWILETGEDTAINMFNPGAMDNMRIRFDSKYVDAGIKIGTKTLLTYEDMYKVAKKTGFVDLYSKVRKSWLGQAFIPGAKLTPGTHESLRLLKKTSAFLEKNFSQPVNYLMSKQINQPYLPLIPYAIERFPGAEIGAESKVKLSKLLKELDVAKTPKLVTKLQKMIVTETPIGKYLTNPQLGNLEAPKALEYIQELMDEKHLFRQTVDAMQTTHDTLYSIANLRGLNMNEVKGYMSHIIASSPKYAGRGKELGPAMYWFQKGREVFDTLYDWKVAKLAGTTKVELLEDPSDIFNIYCSAVATAINKRVFSETVFEDWGHGADYINKQFGSLDGWRFEPNTPGLKLKIAKNAAGKWGAYFPDDIADLVANERDWMYLGDVMTKIAANYGKLKGTWSGLVTYRWLSFAERNYFSSMVNSVTLLGTRVLKPKAFQQANALAAMDLPLGVEKIEVAGKELWNFKKTASKFIDQNYITTDFGKKVNMKTVQLIGEMFGVPGYGWTGRTTQQIMKLGMSPATAMKNLNKRNPLQAAWGALRIGWDLWGDAGSTLSKYVEDSVRWQCFVESWKKWGDPLKAAILTKMFHFDYSELTQFERGWMTKNFAFYKFWRANYPLQLKNYFLKRSFWSGFYRSLQAVEGLSDIRFGPREPTKEPPWFRYEYNMRLPFTWQDKPLYWQPDFMHTAITKLPSAALKFLDFGTSDEARYLGLLQPVTERQYPWINYMPERLMNMDFWRQRSIKYGKEGTLAAPTHIAWAVSKIPFLRDELRLHYKRDPETKEVIPYMDAYWVHFFRQLPFVYQMGLLYNVPGRYGGYFEEQQPLDQMALFTGIKLRTIDAEYSQRQWAWEADRHLQEWRRRQKERQSTEYNPEIFIDSMGVNELYGWDTDNWEELFKQDALKRKTYPSPKDVDWGKIPTGE